MVTAANDPSEHEVGTPVSRRVRLRALWFGLGGAPAAWSMLQMFEYALAAHGCYPHGTPLTHPIVPALGAIALAASLIALAIAGAAGVTALRSWRATRDEGAERDAEPEEGERAGRFMAYAGVAVSLVFLLAIVFNLIAPWLVRPCW